MFRVKLPDVRPDGEPGGADVVAQLAGVLHTHKMVALYMILQRLQVLRLVGLLAEGTVEGGAAFLNFATNIVTRAKADDEGIYLGLEIHVGDDAN